VASVESLAQRFNSLTQVLVNQRSSVMQQRIAMVQNVNDLAAQIADLNRQIAGANNTGANPSGLIDARDMRIDELSSMVGVQVVSQADGSRNVSLAGGQPLVLGGRSSVITINYLPDGTQELQLDFVNDSFSLANVKLGGQLGGLDTFEYSKLVPMMQSVAGLGQEITDRVNTQLAAGFAMDGSAGQPLFQFSVSGPNGTMGLNRTMGLNPATTPDMLAFSGVATEQGNSQNLLALIGLKSQQVTVPQLGTVMLSDAFAQLVSRLGMDSRKNQTSLDTAQTVRNQAEENWKSTSGVNLDEEATNLMQYQQMYQANMKVIAVANDLFDSMLGMFN
jgi:flagellar hook-associated protein 1